jgi:integrase
MGDVFRPTFHRAIPADAKFVVRGGVRYARFRPSKGRIIEGVVLPDGKRCRVETRDYYARIRDSLGRQRRVPLGVTDQEAARQLRAKLQREADQKKAGLLDEYAESRRRPLVGSMKELPKCKHQRDRFGRIIRLSSELAWEQLKRAMEGSHLGDFEVHLRATDRSETHIRETIRVVRRAAIACGFQFVDDLEAGKLDRYLVNLIDANKSRRTRNGALKALRSMVSWMIRTDRLGRDPFRGISTVNEEADPNRRHRRALTPKELAKVVQAAEQSSETIEGVAGPTRAMLYLVAAATGLRRKELSELERRHLSLAANPYVHIPAASTKAKRDDHPIPLHPFVAERLRAWLSSRQILKSDRIFDLTTDSGRLRKTSKMMKGDCEAAGVPYLGDIGVADFHSHRVAFITQLCRTCSDFSTIVDLARHRDPKLTAKVYDRVRLENRTAAIGSLPMPSP